MEGVYLLGFVVQKSNMVGGAVGERVAVTNDESFKHLDDDEEDDYESLCCKLDELLDQDPVACDIQVSWIQP